MCLSAGPTSSWLNRLLVQVVIPVLVDAEHLIGLVVFRMVLDVLRLRRIGVESGQQCRRDHHEDDQQHQHDVDHRRHVRRRTLLLLRRRLMTLPLDYLLNGERRSGVDRAGAARRGVELAREARPAELARHALDEVVDHFLRDVRHLGGEVVDLRREVVVRPHRRDGDEKTERRRDERFGDTTADRGETAGAGRGHAREGVHDAHRGAEQSDERRRGADRGEHRHAALQVRDLEEHVALDRTLGRVDVRHRDRAVCDQRLHFAQRAAEHERDVRLLVALREADGFGEVVFLEELRELRRELDRFLLRLAQAPPLRDHDGQRVDGHDRHGDNDALGEVAHLVPHAKQ